MKSKDLFKLAVQVVGLVFLYHGLMNLPSLVPIALSGTVSTVFTGLLMIAWPLAVAWWLIGGAPFLVVRAYPDSASETAPRGQELAKLTAWCVKQAAPISYLLFFIVAAAVLGRTYAVHRLELGPIATLAVVAFVWQVFTVYHNRRQFLPWLLLAIYGFVLGASWISETRGWRGPN